MEHLSKEELSSLPDTMTFGSLITKQNMKTEDLDILLHKLFSYNNDMLLIRSILGSNKKMIQFLDILAGLTLKIPTHSLILRTINEIEIWRMLQRSEVTQQRIKEVGSLYKLSAPKVKLIYEEYESKFGGGLDGDQKEE